MGTFWRYFWRILCGNNSTKIIVAIFFLSGLFYIYKYIKRNEPQHQKQHGAFLSGFITAFFQAFGMSVGVLRQGYLFSKGYDLPTVQATAAIAFITGGLATIVTRMLHEPFFVKDTFSILILFPFILFTVYIAKRVVYKIPKNIQDKIIIYSLLLSLASAIPYLIA